MKKRKPEVPPLHMERYWSWFCCIPGLTYAQRELLLKCFGNPEALWRASDRELSYLEEKGCAFLHTVKTFRKETPPKKQNIGSKVWDRIYQLRESPLSWET